MPKKSSLEADRAEFRKAMTEMMEARIQMFIDSAPKFAQALAEFRAELEEVGFTREESMQIILKMGEFPRGRPMWRGGGHWHKHGEGQERER